MPKIGMPNITKGRVVPPGCERFTNGELDMLFSLQYSYYMHVGKLNLNIGGSTIPEDYVDAQAVCNTCIEILNRQVSERTLQNVLDLKNGVQ